MKAMILAAGLGTRLRPLTNERPKALVEVNGKTLLETTLVRLQEFGIRQVIVNAYHFAQMIVDYLEANGNFGMEIEISREEELLDTGGGLKNAAHFFLEGSASPDAPFILHNVDVISLIDLHRMLQFHRENQALATLAVQDRKTSRYLLFDEQRKLCGRRTGREAPSEHVRLCTSPQARAFSGIHIISPQIFSLMTETGAFSIIDCYLRLATLGENIIAFPADGYRWRDVGRPEHLAEAEGDLS